MVLQYIEALDALARRSEISATLKQRIESLRSADTTLAAIAEGLAASDDVTFGLADNAAKARGIETFAQHANRFREGKGWLGYHLFRLLQDTNDVRLEEVLEMATERIDLAQVACGPARELGLGPGTESYQLLTSVLQELARFPGAVPDSCSPAFEARSFQTETWRSEPSPPGAESDGRQRFGKPWSLPLGSSPMKTSRHASSACSRADRTTKKYKRHPRIEHGAA